MGFLSRDLVLEGAAVGVGVEAVLELPDSFSVRPLMSEVCDFESAAIYGPAAKGVIDVHHIVPLHRSATASLDSLI